MSFLFGGAEPKPKPVVTPPKIEDKAVQEEKYTELKKLFEMQRLMQAGRSMLHEESSSSDEEGHSKKKGKAVAQKEDEKQSEVQVVVPAAATEIVGSGLDLPSVSNATNDLNDLQGLDEMNGGAGAGYDNLER